MSDRLNERESGRPVLQKRLGQHHLRSGTLVEPLLRWIGTSGGEPSRVLEIGPGGGVLTFALLERGLPTTAWELDPHWAFELHRRVRSRGDLAVSLGLVIGDALDLPWRRLQGVSAVLGNLPYNVATAILQHALAEAREGLRLGFLVQLEVAQRICAPPGSKAYGALSVLVRARCSEPTILGKVKPGSFHPPPKVDSAFVGLELDHGSWSVDEWSALASLVFEAFGKRRKTIRNALSSRRAVGLDSALEQADIDPRQRPEQLGIERWLALHRALHDAFGRAD